MTQLQYPHFFPLLSPPFPNHPASVTPLPSLSCVHAVYLCSFSIENKCSMKLLPSPICLQIPWHSQRHKPRRSGKQILLLCLNDCSLPLPGTKPWWRWIRPIKHWQGDEKQSVLLVWAVQCGTWLLQHQDTPCASSCVVGLTLYPFPCTFRFIFL